jgi:hypothetical protein
MARRPRFSPEPARAFEGCCLDLSFQVSAGPVRSAERPDTNGRDGKGGRVIAAERITCERDGSEVVVAAAIRSGAVLPERMWFGVPAEYEGEVAVDGDPFLPVLAVAGMAHRVPVEIPEVSEELLAGCTRIVEIFDTWSTALGDGLRAVPISAATRPRPRSGRAAGAFFSGGVDSTYTLLRNHDRYPHGDPRRIEYLLLGHGFDVSLEDGALFERVLASVRDVAAAQGVEAIPVRTNVRAFTAGIDWGRYAHGPCLAAVGHLFSPLLHTIYVASSYWFTTLKPWGSHPDIDARWSSERLEFTHHGLEATRADKIQRIARSDAALRTLRVCWRNRDNAFNCGRCEKCLRTMFALSCCGVLPNASTFPPRLDPELIAGLRLKPAEVPFWEDNLRLAARAHADPALIASAGRAVERGRLPAAHAGRVEHPLLARLKRWDERHLKSAVRRAVHAVRRRARE